MENTQTQPAAQVQQNNTQTPPSGAQTPPAQQNNTQTPSFDDFLKTEGNQKEFDKRVGAAVDKAVKEAQARWQDMTNDKLSEAEKLAKMNETDKANYLQAKREKELKEREAAITRRELKAESKGTLAEKGLPAALADVLDYTSAEACKKSLESLEKAFQSAVSAAVETRLKGTEPPKKQTNDSNNMAEQIYKAMLGR